MARTYKRDSRGRFAGGGGSSGRSSGGGGGGKRGSGKGRTPSGQKFKKALRVGAKNTGKFMRNNPGLTARVAIGLTPYAVIGAAALHGKAMDKRASRQMAAAYRHAANRNAARNGLPNAASNLKKARRTIRGAYRVSSVR